MKHVPNELDSDFAITSVAPASTLCGGDKDDNEEEIGLKGDDDEKMIEDENSEPVKIFTKTYGLLIFWFVVCNVFILIKFAFFNMWLNWYFDGDQAQAERNVLLSSAIRRLRAVGLSRESAVDLWTKCMLVSFFVSPGVGLFVDNVFREDKCKSLAIAVTGITAFVLIICLASLVKGLYITVQPSRKQFLEIKSRARDCQQARLLETKSINLPFI